MNSVKVLPLSGVQLLACEVGLLQHLDLQPGAERKAHVLHVLRLEGVQVQSEVVGLSVGEQTGLCLRHVYL
jgi:hypothetical protein